MTITKRFNLITKSKTSQRVLESFELKNKKVLDLGCGRGEYLFSFEAGSIGVTTNEEEVSSGRANSINIKKGNAEFLEESLLVDEGFEAFWANNLFEHLLSPYSFLIKLKKNSEGNAKLILGVPVIPCFYFLIKIRKFMGALSSSHVGFYTKSTLKLTVERAGWIVEDVRPFVFNNKHLDFLVSFFIPPSLCYYKK